MKFIRKKNLLDGEKLLYSPKLHWFYIVKPLFISLSVFLCLLVFYAFARLFTPYWVLYRLFLEFRIGYFSRNVLLTFGLILLVILLVRIISYLYVEYGVTNKRLIMKKGAICIKTAEIPVDRIESIYISQGCLGRVFNFGTVVVSGVGGKEPAFFMVCRPYAVRRRIAEIIEKNKRITVIHGEFPGAARVEKPGSIEEEPVYLYGTFVRMMPDNNR